MAPARVPSPPAIATRCATPLLLTCAFPPVVPQQQSLLQTFPCHRIQSTVDVMATAAIMSRLLRAYRETKRVYERSSVCNNAQTERYSVNALAPGDRSAADTLTEYDTIARAVPWAPSRDLLPCHHNPTRRALSTLLPLQVGTFADSRCHPVRVMRVPRSLQAPSGVMQADVQLADVVPRVQSVTVEAWAVPAGLA